MVNKSIIIDITATYDTSHTLGKVVTFALCSFQLGCAVQLYHIKFGNYDAQTRNIW